MTITEGPLKPCPCGKTPGRLFISEGSTYRWRIVSGDCCGDWQVEAPVLDCHTEEKIRAACTNAWNEAARA